jgi:polar amino acid transport system substrate-binding protein/glutamate/aspartate transport system substrate-binding protein
MRLAPTCAALGLCLLATAPTAQTLDRIAATGEIRLGVRSDAPPLSFIADGKPQGYAVDLCLGVMDHLEKEAVGARDGVPLKPVFVTVTAENRFEKLAGDEIDMLCGAATVTLARRALVDFSIPTYVDGASVMTRKGGPLEFGALAGQRIGVRAGTTTADSLRVTLDNLGMQAEVVTVADHAAGAEGVLDGSLAAYFADQSILFGLSRSHPRSADLQVSRDVLTVETQAIGLKLGDTAMRLAVDTALSRLYRSGAVARMFEIAFSPAQMGAAMEALVALAPLRE